MKAVIDPKKCPAQQQICRPILVCAASALSYVADEALPLGGRIAIDYERCDGCGRCAVECCGHAIEMRNK